MPGIVIDNHKAVYWPVPKNACTSIKQLCATLSGLYWSGTVHDAEFTLIQQFDDLPNHLHFGIVRHPTARLYSLWQDKIKDPGITDEGYLKGVHRIVLQPYGDLFFGGMSFYEFIRAVVQIPHHQADPHFSPQYLQLPKANIYLMRFESLQQETQKLFSILNIDRPLPHLNAAKHTPRRLITLESLYHYYHLDFATYGY